MNKVMKEILSTSIYLLVVMLSTYLIVKFVGQVTIVNGASMEPYLQGTSDENPDKVGDKLILDKISYRFSEPKRYDIIVFPFKYNGDNYIKRIIGMPGETVQIDIEGVIYINGEVLREGYGKEVMLDPGRAIQPITLGPDEYFVLGDNRNHSSDSRTEMVGNIHKNEIMGKAFVRIWPLSRIGILKHQ